MDHRDGTFPSWSTSSVFFVDDPAYHGNNTAILARHNGKATLSLLDGRKLARENKSPLAFFT